MGLILINISGDWIGQPAPQKLQKIKQNGIIICNAGRVRALARRYNQSGGFNSLRGGSFVTPLARANCQPPFQNLSGNHEPTTRGESVLLSATNSHNIIISRCRDEPQRWSNTIYINNTSIHSKLIPI